MPSVADMFFVVLLAGLSCGALGRLLLRDADTGWHIRNGQLVLANHAITRVDAFSSTMAGKTWYAWEWLYDLLIGAIHLVFGLNGVVFYSAAIIAAAFVLALHVCLRRGANLPVALFLLIVALGASAVHFLARPHVVSWLFAVIWFDVLDSAAENSRDHLFWLPALMVLWVNLHGGFVLGFLLVGVYLVAGGIDYYFHREKRVEILAWLMRLGTVTGLCALASLVNPYTYHLHVHVVRYLSDRFLMDRISEFLSPDFHAVAQQCFAVLLLLTVVALASARGRPMTARLLVVLLAAYTGFYATRNLPTSSLLICIVIAPVFSESIRAAGSDSRIAPWLRGFFSWLDGFGERMGKMEFEFRGHLWIVVAFVLGLWACANRGRIGSEQVIHAYFDEKKFPVAAVNAIAERGIHEPIFTLDYWGGYVIYRLYPQNKVVVDDRHDLYGDQFFKDYLKIVWAQEGWDKTLADMHVNCILAPTDSTLAGILRITPAWKMTYDDDVGEVFQKEER